MINFESEILTPLYNNIERFADRNAFCIADEFYTYRQLGERIEALRTVIRENGFSNKIIGVVAHDSIDTYAALLALWAEGSAYVILHSEWPKERIDEIIQQAELEAYIDNGELTQLEGYSHNDLQLAYVLFTSGSTGKPKGVMVGKDNLAAMMNSFWATGIDITEEDRVLQCAELTFDYSVWCMLMAITKGACLYTIPDEEIRFQYTGGLIDEYALTVLPVVPSTLRYLQPYFEELDMSCIRYCILGAEALQLSIVEEFRKYAPNAEILNYYGPTECAIASTFYQTPSSPLKGGCKNHNGVVAIGKVLKNITAVVLDEEGNELPVGEKGELCIGGPHVTRGYLNNEELTCKSYFVKEVDGRPMRFYHSGDLVFQDADGDIMYVGRIDHQAKIQGFRVELSEIEHHAVTFFKNSLHREGWGGVVCLAFDNEQGFTEIAMFIESEEFDIEPTLQYMRTKMPSYMIPTRIVFVPVFPLNTNGKIDRNDLKSKIVNCK